MERRDRVPVGAAEKPARAEAGGLHEQRSAGDWFDRPLEPGLPGEPHLGNQHEQPIGFEVLDAPEVHGLTDRKAVGVATAASKAGSASDPVHQTPRLPEHLTPIPALFTADTAHCLPGAMRISGHHRGTDVGELGTARPTRVGCRRLPDGRGSVIELRRDVAHCGPADRAVDGGGEGNAFEGEERLGAVVGDGHRVDERVDQWAGDLRGHGGDQPDPQRRQTRGEHGNGDEPPFLESSFPYVDRHHFGIRDDIGAPDLENPRESTRLFDHCDEVTEHVADGDRLAARVDPFRSDHDGEDLGEIAQHLEARGPRADDDGGTKLDYFDRTRGEDFADVVAAAQVHAEFAVVVSEPAEVDDPTNAGGLCGSSKVLRDGAFAGDPVLAFSDAVHEKHRDIDAGHRRAEVLGNVGLHDLDPPTPRCRVELARVAHDAPDAVPTVEERRHEPSTHVARRARDENSRRR